MSVCFLWIKFKHKKLPPSARKATWHNFSLLHTVYIQYTLQKTNDLQTNLNHQGPRTDKKHLFFEWNSYGTDTSLLFQHLDPMICLQNIHVQSTVARATQMCWQGFSQSAISRTARYNLFLYQILQPATVFKRLTPGCFSSSYLALVLHADHSSLVIWGCHFPNTHCLKSNLVLVTVFAVSWK